MPNAKTPCTRCPSNHARWCQHNIPSADMHSPPDHQPTHAPTQAWFQALLPITHTYTHMGKSAVRMHLRLTPISATQGGHTKYTRWCHCIRATWAAAPRRTHPHVGARMHSRRNLDEKAVLQSYRMYCTHRKGQCAPQAHMRRSPVVAAHTLQRMDGPKRKGAGN